LIYASGCTSDFDVIFRKGKFSRTKRREAALIKNAAPAKSADYD
jgi:hypothetical protein